MASATKLAKTRGGGEGGQLLKGSDLPKTMREVVLQFNAVREAPEEWDSALVADIEEMAGCMAFALNKTNIKRLVALIGDEYEEWAGYDVTMAVVAVDNPKTGVPTRGLRVESVKKSKRKPKGDGRNPI